MGFRQIFTVSSLPLVQIWHGIQAYSVNTHSQPEVEHAEHRFADFGVIEIKVWLMAIKPMPKIRAGHRVPTPIRCLEILKNDPRFPVFLGRVVPNVPITLSRARCRTP